MEKSFNLGFREHLDAHPGEWVAFEVRGDEPRIVSTAARLDDEAMLGALAAARKDERPGMFQIMRTEDMFATIGIMAASGVDLPADELAAIGQDLLRLAEAARVINALAE